MNIFQMHHHLKFDQYFDQYRLWLSWVNIMFIFTKNHFCTNPKHHKHPNTTNDTTNAITLAATSLA